MAERPKEIAAGTPGPGYARAPQHRVALVPRHLQVVIRCGELTVADTADLVAVEEGGYPARYYLAREGVDMSRLERTDKVTYCPFKGLATYYHLRGPDGTVEDVAWSYEQPYREGELLRDRLAFDANKVEEVTGGT